MPIDYPAVLDLREEARRFTWSERDTMLYALAVGMGRDPSDRRELPFVYEKGLKALPTLATVIAWGAGISPDRIGLDRRTTLHGEEALAIHRPLPVAGDILATSRVLAVYDKGARGAIVERETVLKEATSGEPLATLVRTAFARSDGGFGGPSASPAVAPTPTRPPDAVLEFATRPEQALLYRLCGDRNPLHADPDAAQAAGFAAPILHGLCTYGICCRAVLQAFCGFEPARVKRHAVRFSAPVMPGDVVRVTLWNDAGAVSFEADVPARGVSVIKNGKALIV